MSGDIILTMVLIYVLRKSRTGVNKYVSPSAASRSSIAVSLRRRC